MTEPTLGWVDYGLFGTFLLISALIGLFNCRGQSKSPGQFLHAGGKMGYIPVSLSMLSSFISSITVIGQPAEVYLYGSQLWMFGVSSFLIIPIVGYIIVPFFRGKNYYSAYQYFGERFDRKLQTLSSVLFTFQMIIYLAVVMYAPAVAMTQVSGMNTMAIVSLTYAVCIFYTVVGGMKGVVWTDGFQIILIFGSMAAVLYKGTSDIGGFSVVWERNQEFNRTIFFNFDLDMTERYTFWSTFLGLGVFHMSTYGGNQMQIQRYQTVSSMKEATKMLWLNTIGWTLITFMCVYAGLLLFATYCYCDPLLTQRINSADQLFPLYVIDVLRNYPGYSGLFLCTIFSGGLSTISTGVNSLAAIWFAELEGTRFRENLSEAQSGLLTKLMALAFGMISYFLVFAVPYMGGFVQIGISLTSILTGSLLGIFLLGICFSKADAWGATVGLITSVIFLSWISLGENFSNKSGFKVHPPLPSSVKACDVPINVPRLDDQEYAFYLYRISYTWYCMIAVIITLVTGNLVSYAVALLKKRNPATPPNTDQDPKCTNLLLKEKYTKTVIAPTNWSKV